MLKQVFLKQAEMPPQSQLVLCLSIGGSRICKKINVKNEASVIGRLLRSLNPQMLRTFIKRGGTKNVEKAD